MKKNLYLWIFIGVAIILCVLIFMAYKSMLGGDANRESSLNNVNLQRIKNNEVAEQKKVNLTEGDVDFEEDADDLSDGFVDDSQFDESSSFDSIENEVY